MQREEKQLENLIEAVLSRLNDLKHSIGAMIHKIETEYETINWPTFLDNFALISSHVSNIHTSIIDHSMNQSSEFVTFVHTVDRVVENSCSRIGATASKFDCASIAIVSGAR